MLASSHGYYTFNEFYDDLVYSAIDSDVFCDFFHTDGELMVCFGLESEYEDD